MDGGLGLISVKLGFENLDRGSLQTHQDVVQIFLLFLVGKRARERGIDGRRGESLKGSCMLQCTTQITNELQIHRVISPSPQFAVKCSGKLRQANLGIQASCNSALKSTSPSRNTADSNSQPQL
jgi:hypothetical protein